MKSFFALALFASTISSACACSPPPAIMAQKIALDVALNSKALNKILEAQMVGDFTVSITSIKVKEDVIVALSNGCSIRVSTTYKAPVQNGMCPRVDKTTALETCR